MLYFKSNKLNVFEKKNFIFKSISHGVIVIF